MNINNPTTFGTPNLSFSTTNSSGTGGALRSDDTLAIWAAPTVVMGSTAAIGSAATGIRSNSTLAAVDTTVPGNIALGASAATGSINFASRRDHNHGTVDVLLRIVTGSYDGDAQSTQEIEDLSITPSFISIIKKSDGGGNEVMFQTWSSIVDDNAAGLGYIWGSPTVHGALVLDHLRSFEDGGFIVGDDATQASLNGSGNTYNFVAIGY